MGLLDSVIGSVAGNLLGGGAQGGGQAQMVQVLLGMLTQGGGDQGGGLGALLGKLNGAGLGDVAASWVGTGANLPISPDQVTQALGSDTLGQLASQLGMDHGQAAGHLSELLPGVIDALTPHGQMPSGNADLSSLATQVLGKFLQR